MKTVIFIIIAIIGVTSSILTNNHIKERQCYKQQMTEIRQKLHKEYEEKQYLNNLKSQDANLSCKLYKKKEELRNLELKFDDVELVRKFIDCYDGEKKQEMIAYIKSFDSEKTLNRISELLDEIEKLEKRRSECEEQLPRSVPIPPASFFKN